MKLKKKIIIGIIIISLLITLGIFIFYNNNYDENISLERFIQNAIKLFVGEVPEGISFVSPTPASGTFTGDNSVIINYSINSSNLKEVIHNWNGTNYSLYDNSIQGYWNFDNLSVFGESENHIYDVSGNGYNFSTTNASYVTGKYGKSIRFKGIGSWANVTWNGNEVKGLTVDMWFNRLGDGTGNFGGIDLEWLVNDRGPGGADRDYQVYLWGNEELRANIWNNSDVSHLVVGSVNVTSNNVWHHFVLTVNTSSQLAKMYLDGQEIGSVDFYGDIQNISTVMGLGSNGWGFGNFNFNGTIDNLKIMNRSINAIEVNQSYMSNLYYYDTDLWALYINQTNLPQQSINEGNYTYQGFAYNSSNSLNLTEVRNVIVDRTFPTWSNNKTNLSATTNINETVYFNITLSETNPDKYIFSFYNGSVWINDSDVSYTNGEEIEILKSINVSEGTIQWYWIFNDSAGNQNQTDTWSVTLLGDKTLPVVNFTGNTPENGSTYSYRVLPITATIVESNLENITYNWNGLDYFIPYQDSIRVLHNFENLSILGENDSFIVGESPYSVNSSCKSGKCPVLVNGRQGKAFNYTSDYFNFTHTDSLNISNEITISVWVYPYTLSGTDYIIDKGNNEAFELVLVNGQVNFKDSLNNVLTTNTLPVNSWTNIIATGNSTGLFIYFNTTLEGNKSVAYSGSERSLSPMYLGSSADGSYFDGIIDELIILNKSISGDDIYFNYISNLKKTNSNSFEFSINQTYNSTTEDIPDGDYNFSITAYDTVGNIGTEKRTITIYQSALTIENETVYQKMSLAGIEFVLNQTANSRLRVSNESDMTPLIYEVWDNGTSNPYYYGFWKNYAVQTNHTYYYEFFSQTPSNISINASSNGTFTTGTLPVTKASIGDVTLNWSDSIVGKVNTNSTRRVAFNFTTSNSFNLTLATIKINNTVGGFGNITLNIRQDNSGEPGALIYNFTHNRVNSSYYPYDSYFKFEDDYSELNASSTYWVEIYGGNSVDIGLATSTSHSGYGYLISNDGGSTWGSYTEENLVFSLYENTKSPVLFRATRPSIGYINTTNLTILGYQEVNETSGNRLDTLTIAISTDGGVKFRNNTIIYDYSDVGYTTIDGQGDIFHDNGKVYWYFWNQTSGDTFMGTCCSSGNLDIDSLINPNNWSAPLKIFENNTVNYANEHFYSQTLLKNSDGTAHKINGNYTGFVGARNSTFDPSTNNAGDNSVVTWTASNLSDPNSYSLGNVIMTDSNFGDICTEDNCELLNDPAGRTVSVPSGWYDGSKYYMVFQNWNGTYDARLNRTDEFVSIAYSDYYNSSWKQLGKLFGMGRDPTAGYGTDYDYIISVNPNYVRVNGDSDFRIYTYTVPVDGLWWFDSGISYVTLSNEFLPLDVEYISPTASNNTLQDIEITTINVSVSREVVSCILTMNGNEYNLSSSGVLKYFIKFTDLIPNNNLFSVTCEESGGLTGNTETRTISFNSPLSKDMFFEPYNESLPLDDEWHHGAFQANWTKATYSSTDDAIFVNNTIMSNLSSGGAIYYYPSHVITNENYTIQALFKLKSLANANHSILGRVSTTNESFYGLEYSVFSGNISLIKAVNGTITTLNTTNLTWNAYEEYMLKLVMNGSSLEGYWNGTLKITANDSILNYPGKGGLRFVADDIQNITQGLAIDNFKTYRITTPITFSEEGIDNPIISRTGNSSDADGGSVRDVHFTKTNDTFNVIYTGLHDVTIAASGTGRVLLATSTNHTSNYTRQGQMILNKRFVLDTFQEVNGTLLETHSPENGWWENWSKISGNDIIIEANRMRVNETSSGTSLYYLFDPACSQKATARGNLSGEYKIIANFTNLDGAFQGGITARMSFNGSNYYSAEYNTTDSEWRLYKSIDSSKTLLGTYAEAFTINTSKTITLSIEDVNKTLFIDGVLRINSSDNSITERGRGGIVASGVGMGISRFEEYTIGEEQTADPWVFYEANSSGGNGTWHMFFSSNIAHCLGKMTETGLVKNATFGQIAAGQRTASGDENSLPMNDDAWALIGRKVLIGKTTGWSSGTNGTLIGVASPKLVDGQNGGYVMWLANWAAEPVEENGYKAGYATSDTLYGPWNLSEYEAAGNPNNYQAEQATPITYGGDYYLIINRNGEYGARNTGFPLWTQKYIDVWKAPSQLGDYELVDVDVFNRGEYNWSSGFTGVAAIVQHQLTGDIEGLYDGATYVPGSSSAILRDLGAIKLLAPFSTILNASNTDANGTNLDWDDYTLSFANYSIARHTDNTVNISHEIGRTNVSNYHDESATNSTEYFYKLFILDGSDNILYESNIVNITTLSSVSDTCIYTSGNWNVQCSDNCVISSNVVMDSGANMTINGTGSFTLNPNINITGINQLALKINTGGSFCRVGYGTKSKTTS